MTLESRASEPWLPTRCLTSRRMVEPLERAVSAWVDDWFAQDSWEVLACWDIVSSTCASNWLTLREDSGLQLKGKDKTIHNLALAILGQARQPKYTVTDLRLMQGIASKALDDLLASIRQLFGVAGAGRSQDNTAAAKRYSISIGPVGNTQLAIECNVAQLVALARKTFPILLNRRPLADISAAINAEKVEFATSLGSASINLEQFSHLSVGDILLLDRSQNEPAQLILGGRTTALSVFIHEVDETVTLQLQDST